MRNRCSFGILVLYCAVGMHVQAAQRDQVSGKNTPQQTDSAQKNTGFTMKTVGNGRALDGTRLGFRDYENSDGVQVSVTYGTFDSPEKARAELQRWLQGARKVIERKPTKNSSGEIIGERAVATFTNNKIHRDSAAIIWTDGPEWHLIQSWSLPVALQFEKWSKE